MTVIVCGRLSASCGRHCHRDVSVGCGDRDLMEELVPLMKEAIDRKADNPRRRKRRDILRLSLLRILLYMANNGIFARW